MIKSKNRNGMQIVGTSHEQDLAPGDTGRLEDVEIALFPRIGTRSCMGYDTSTAVSLCGMGSGIADALNRARVYKERKMEAIRLRAYELFEERGKIDGYDLEDWLQAEAEFNASRISLVQQKKAA